MYTIKVYYKYPKTICFGTFNHQYKYIAWLKALWFTKFGWRFFNYSESCGGL